MQGKIKSQGIYDQDKALAQGKNLSSIRLNTEGGTTSFPSDDAAHVSSGVIGASFKSASVNSEILRMRRYVNQGEQSWARQIE